MHTEEKILNLTAKKGLLIILALLMLSVLLTAPAPPTAVAAVSQNGANGPAYRPPQLDKAVVTPDDFEFIGAFCLPQGMLDGGWLDYYDGLTHRYVDGRLKFYTLAGPYSNRPPGGYMIEIELPEDISQTKPYPRQNAYISFGDIFQDKITKISEGFTPDNPGVGLANTGIPNIFWDEQDQRMYWSKVTYFDNSYWPDTSFGYAVLDDETHSGAGVGNWIIPSNVNPGGGRRWTFKVTDIPEWFADTYLGGRRLGVGFGGCASIVSNGVSLGPTLYAIMPPDPAIEPHMSMLTTSSISLISHVFGFERPATLNAALPHFESESKDIYNWGTYSGTCPNGLWIDSANKHGLIVFATLNCGNANTTVIRVIAANSLEVADPGDIRPGDQIFVNTDWLDDGSHGYQNESAIVAGVEGRIISFVNPLKGNPIIEDYTAEVTYSNGDVRTINYVNRVVCGTIYYGGGPKHSRYLNAWYIYDPADLATVAQGQLAPDEVAPVFNGQVDFPNIEYPLKGNLDPINILGATFDNITDRLYVLTRGQDSWNTVYIYQLNDEPAKPAISGHILYQTSPRPAAVKLYNNNGELIHMEVSEANGLYALPAPPGPGYTLVITKPGYLSYTIKNLTLTEGENLPTVDLRQMAGDIDGDGVVNATDLTYLLSEFNRDPANSAHPYADINGDGIVNATDLTYLLAGFNKHDAEIIM